MKQPSIGWKKWLENQLISDRSKKNIERIAAIARTEPNLIEAIFVCAEEGKDKVDWRSAWVLDHLNQMDPVVVTPYIGRMIAFLPTTTNDSLLRTYLKVLGQNNVPVENSGVLMDLCFTLVNNPQTAIAVRVWCMDILVNFAQIYPAIISELKPILLLILETGSGGERSRARKMLKTLDKVS